MYRFRQHTEAEEHNLREIYKVQAVPSDNGLRKILDEVSSDALRDSFPALFKKAEQSRVLNSFRSWRNHYIFSIDGVEHFCSKQVSCPHCMKRNHRDGTQSNYHAMLSAALVNPDLREVLVVDNEPIINEDGFQKNDCERNAAKRLLVNLQKTHNEEDITFTMDALYACSPLIKQIRQQPSWHYLIGVTEKGNKALFRQFDELEQAGEIKWERHKNKQETFVLGYANGLYLNDSAQDVKCNMLYCIWTDKKGREVIFSWVTDLPLTKRTARKFMRIARSRWKIENEVFNTLKNQGYQFEHNFGHGIKNLCTNFAYLMMLAFCVDQLQQLASSIFQQILAKLKTRVKFWEFMQSVFKLVPCVSMKNLYLKIAEVCRIKLESG